MILINRKISIPHLINICIDIPIQYLYEWSLFSLKDFTVFGGSLSGAHAKKICKVNLNK